MEMHSPFPALRDFHLKVKRLTMICASLALLHPLLSLTHWIFGSLMLPYKSSSHSAKYVRWCDSCSLATPMQRAELNTARQSSHKSPARDDGAGGPPIVISTEAKRSGEISRPKWQKSRPAPSVISTKAGQPPIGKPLIVQARGQLRLTWRLYAESPQSGEISPL